ncbi:uncharacterized protein LOC118268810 [Spodoptera frugiperda]|uniref:Uncharacterized protein LOC118268810 n=1 Tax=Spodoptera frugiperda TaxID=7108 RepID=A0A9R0D437_SPOFR|nr:uncharacterized protein LOC118268810 [Spodoptera frugiperda]
MLGYNVLEVDHMPDPLKNQPRWKVCLTVTLVLVAITGTAVTIGALTGYTYCYIEHHTMGGQQNRTNNFTYVRLTPVYESEKAKRNRSINGAISTLLITKLFDSGWSQTHDEPSNDPSNDDSSSEEEGWIHILL